MQQAQIRRTASSTSQPKEEQPLVMIVDDDAAIREALHELMLSAGMQPACFASTRDLLDAGVLDRPGCLILDVRMPGCKRPRSAASSRGEGNAQADHFPYRAWRHPDDCASHEVGRRRLPHEARAGPDVARRRHRGDRAGRCTREPGPARQTHIERLETLTPRERQVFAEVARGRLNKQIAFDLGISEVTVKLHRSNVMRKMQAASVGELIRAWEALPADMREARSSLDHRMVTIPLRPGDM